MHAPQHIELLSPRRQHRHVFGQAISRRGGRDGIELAAVLGGCLRLHVPGVELRTASLQEQDDRSFGGRICDRRFGEDVSPTDQGSGGNAAGLEKRTS